ncbi:MAG: phosphoribosylglycinamide formyltransferase [Bacteroidales bacterium]|nr:phosphoribosylglycinamide formyltransferase [Bacteroidales bacterium]MBN2634000.1 phosphoribosylglycinamide formyltransferase [Bacteroidales bacterium]
MKNIAIFASGSGTNAENIIRHFSTGNLAGVTLVLSNRREAYVLQRAEALNVKTIFFDRNDFYISGKVLQDLFHAKPDLIVLAGFLWLVPDPILKAFEGRIINIHPALLPSYGGKGMYGEKVHRAVIESGDHESGITIHYVNSRYDEGDIIFQASCSVEPDDTPETLAAKVHAMEYKYYPLVIEDLLQKMP